MIHHLVLHKWYSKTNPDKPMIGIPENDVNYWLEANEDIQIRCEWEIMTISVEDLQARILFKHTITAKDGTKITLVNFAWEKDGTEAEKKRQKINDKKKATMMKAYELSNKLHQQDPEAWYKKYVL
jgi:hypothetical protein